MLKSFHKISKKIALRFPKSDPKKVQKVSFKASKIPKGVPKMFKIPHIDV